MTNFEVSRPHSASLADAIDALLTKGAVVVGEAQIGLADIPLIYVGLNLVLASAETFGLEPPSPTSGEHSRPRTPSGPATLAGALPRPGPSLAAPEAAMERPPTLPSPTRGEEEVAGDGQPSAAPHAAAYPLPEGEGRRDGEGAREGQLRLPPGFEDVMREERSGSERVASSGLAQLVLTLVELLRQLMERQALHRMEGGRLNDEAIERMGLALMELSEKMAELRELFDLTEEDVNLDLGPLGRLLA